MKSHKVVRNGHLLALAVALVAYEYGVPAAAVRARGRGKPRVAEARHVAVYLLVTVGDITATEAADLIGRDRSTVRHSLEVVEDARDDPRVDSRLDALAEWLVAVMERAA